MRVRCSAFERLRSGNGGAFGIPVGVLPGAGVDVKVGVGEAGSVAPIWERGTAVESVETSVTEGEGRSDGTGVDVMDDWAFAKREDKRMEMTASWKMDTTILENAVVTVVVVVDGREREGGGWRKRGNSADHTRLPSRQFQL